METVEFSAVLARLKGASLHVLMTLRHLNRPANPAEISQISRYSLPTVQHVLPDLVFDGFAEYDGDRDEWAASDYAREQLVWLNDEVEVSEDHVSQEHVSEDQGEESPCTGETEETQKNFVITPCSSSSFISKELKQTKKLLLPTTKPPPKTRKTRKKPLDALPDGPDIVRAYERLLRTGLGDAAAVSAIRKALEEGLGGDQIYAAVEGWLAYAASERGTTIKHPGFFAASRLGSGLSPPEVAGREDEMSPKRYTSGKFGHLIKS